MMDGGMGPMMDSMMGIGLLGWVLVIALLVAILVVLVRLLNERRSSGGQRPTSGTTDRPHVP